MSDDIASAVNEARRAIDNLVEVSIAAVGGKAPPFLIDGLRGDKERLEKETVELRKRAEAAERKLDASIHAQHAQRTIDRQAESYLELNDRHEKLLLQVREAQRIEICFGCQRYEAEGSCAADENGDGPFCRQCMRQKLIAARAETSKLAHQLSDTEALRKSAELEIQEWERKYEAQETDVKKFSRLPGTPFPGTLEASIALLAERVVRLEKAEALRGQVTIENGGYRPISAQQESDADTPKSIGDIRLGMSIK